MKIIFKKKKKKRPIVQRSQTKHAYGNICTFSTLRFRPIFVLVFPSNKSFVLSCNLLVHSPLWYPWQWHTDNDPIEVRINLYQFLGSCTYWALCIWAYSSWFLPMKPARTPSGFPTLRSLSFFSYISKPIYRDLRFECRFFSLQF